MKIVFFTYMPLEFGAGLSKYFIETASSLSSRYKDLDISIVTFDERLCKKILLFYSIYFMRKSDSHMLSSEDEGSIRRRLGKVRYIKTSSFHNAAKILAGCDRIYTQSELVQLLITKILSFYIKLPPLIIGFHIPLHYHYTPSLQSRAHNLLYKSFLYKFLLQNALRLHANNIADEKQLQLLCPKKQIVRIYYPFDGKAFRNQAKSARYPYAWKEEKFQIIWAGRLTEQKGVNDLLEVITAINRDKLLAKVQWNIFGEGDQRQAVEDIVKQWGNIVYHGYVKNKYMPSVYKHADLFISTSKWEVLPFNLLEAQSCGVPAVCYDIPGCTDIVENKKTGTVVSNKDEFIKAIIKVANRKTTMNKKLISNHLQKKFNPETIYEQIYKKIFTN